MATAKKKVEKPRWRPAEAVRRGSAALELARRYRAKIEPQDWLLKFQVWLLELQTWLLKFQV